MRFDSLERKVYIDLQRSEELAEDTEFKKVKFVDEYHTFLKGDFVTARYQAVVVVDLPKNISYVDTSTYLHRVNNAYSGLLMLYGDKVLDNKFLQKKAIKEILPEVPCELVELTREFYTYTHTGRGGRYDFATETEDLMIERNNNKGL